jgi:hypothetical protein
MLAGAGQTEGTKAAADEQQLEVHPQAVRRFLRLPACKPVSQSVSVRSVQGFHTADYVPAGEGVALSE